MDSSELLRRLEGEGESTSRQDEAPTDSSADSRANKALRAEMGPRLDDLMGLLAWLKTEQAKLGGRGKAETIERIFDGMERISKWLETGGKTQGGGETDTMPPTEQGAADDQTFRRRLFDALAAVEHGIQAMTERKAVLDDGSISQVESGLRDMGEILKTQ